MADAKTPSAELKRWRSKEGVSQVETAKRLSSSRLTVVEIESGVRRVTPEMAIKLESLTGIDAKRWCWWQINIDIDQLRNRK